VKKKHARGIFGIDVVVDLETSKATVLLQPERGK
jgi:hypothetical protein